MVSYMCQLDGAKGAQVAGKTLLVAVSVKVLHLIQQTA